jgi:hypothetical protein
LIDHDRFHVRSVYLAQCAANIFDKKSQEAPIPGADNEAFALGAADRVFDVYEIIAQQCTASQKNEKLDSLAAGCGHAS